MTSAGGWTGWLRATSLSGPTPRSSRCSPTKRRATSALGEIRQHQNRWPEAVAEWQQVARLRELEPTGLLGLTAALVHEGRWDEAGAALAKLEGRVWPPRFGGVEAQTGRLHRQIDARRRASP